MDSITDIKYNTIEEWEIIKEKIRDGFIICPQCHQWVNRIFKIPLRYKGFIKNILDGYALWGEKDTYEYCCDYCISSRANLKAKREWASKFGICRSCDEVFEKEKLGFYQKYKNCSPEWNLCQSCIDKKSAEHNRYKSLRKERNRVISNNNRTSRLGLVSDLSVEEWIRIIELYNNKCAYCGDKWTDLEHIIPVSEGGGTTKNNVVPACSSCNMKKRYKTNFVSKEFLDAHSSATS